MIDYQIEVRLALEGGHFKATALPRSRELPCLQASGQSGQRALEKLALYIGVVEKAFRAKADHGCVLPETWEAWNDRIRAAGIAP